MDDDQIDRILEAVAVDQIILRALLCESLKRFAKNETSPDEAMREYVNSLYRTIDLYDVPGADAAHMEKLREAARQNIDALVSLSKRSDG
ncbi:MAG: hypothetical protein WD767_10350 [Alphaproteobacteria bacterium]